MKKINYEDIRDKFKDFVGYIRYSDGEYNCPKKSWLLNDYYDWFKSDFMPFLGIASWKKQFDCDDFTSAYKLGAQAAHARSDPKNADGLALAEIWYQDSGASGVFNGHAIIMACTGDKWIFIEPQNGKEIFLSEKEQKSIYFIRF